MPLSQWKFQCIRHCLVLFFYCQHLGESDRGKQNDAIALYYILGVSQRYSSILDFSEAKCWIKFDELYDHVSFLQLRYWDVHSAFAMFVLLFVLLLLLFNHIAGGTTRLLALLRL